MPLQALFTPLAAIWGFGLSAKDATMNEERVGFDLPVTRQLTLLALLLEVKECSLQLIATSSGKKVQIFA